MKKTGFEWEDSKDEENQEKHQVSFADAQHAFADPNRVISEDIGHSHSEERYQCIGMVGQGVLTVCFTYRKGRIRIISAGHWRKGRKLYEEQNPVH